MAVSPKTLEMVSCPQCQGELKLTKEEVLFCIRCRLCYPVEEGIPNLSMGVSLPLTPDGKVRERKRGALFTVVSGPDEGTQFRLEEGQCKAIGRKIEDMSATQVFNVDFTMSLDDHTKKLIMNYLSKAAGKKKEGKDLGAYQRAPDLIVNDPAVSRLHAMIFFDETGAGVLDLVSSNGTFVGGREVEASRLKSGDKIKLGSTIIGFEIK